MVAGVRREHGRNGEARLLGQLLDGVRPLRQAARLQVIAHNKVALVPLLHRLLAGGGGEHRLGKGNPGDRVLILPHILIVEELALNGVGEERGIARVVGANDHQPRLFFYAQATGKVCRALRWGQPPILKGAEHPVAVEVAECLSVDCDRGNYVGNNLHTCEFNEIVGLTPVVARICLAVVFWGL